MDVEFENFPAVSDSSLPAILTKPLGIVKPEFTAKLVAKGIQTYPTDNFVELPTEPKVMIEEAVSCFYCVFQGKALG